MSQQQIFINDVGPRDGLQNQKTLVSLSDRESLIEHLTASNVAGIEVGAFVSPKAVPAMAGTGELFNTLGEQSSREDIVYSALIPNLKGYELAKAAGAKTVSLVVAVSDTMNLKNIGMTTEQAISVCEQVFNANDAEDINVQVYLATAWECPFEGEIDQKSVISAAAELLKLGASRLVIADTIGAANPMQVKSLMNQLLMLTSADKLACHFHDTRAMGLANVYAAIEAGIRHFDASIAGLGGCPFAPGASGNVATEDVAFMCEKMGFSTGIDLQKLVEAADFAIKVAPTTQGGKALGYIKQYLQN